MEKSVYAANEALRKENALLKEENAAMTELLEKRGLLSALPESVLLGKLAAPDPDFVDFTVIHQIKIRVRWWRVGDSVEPILRDMERLLMHPVMIKPAIFELTSFAFNVVDLIAGHNYRSKDRFQYGYEDTLHIDQTALKFATAKDWFTDKFTSASGNLMGIIEHIEESAYGLAGEWEEYEEQWRFQSDSLAYLHGVRRQILSKMLATKIAGHKLPPELVILVEQDILRLMSRRVPRWQPEEFFLDD